MFFSRLRNVLFFIFSKRFLRGKNLWFQEDFFPKTYYSCARNLYFVSPKFSSQTWKYLLFISSFYSLYDTIHVPPISW